MRRALRAEAAFDFWSAARWFRTAARHSCDPDLAALHGMRAARALQKGENWRTQSASWELLGNELGALLPGDKAERDRRYADPEGRETVRGFYVIADAEWDDPPHQRYGEDKGAVRRHHQAQAYQWAGETAAADLQYADAARLFRRAGVAWEASARKNRFARARDCYYQAAIAAAQSSRIPTRRMIHEEPYCPACLRDKSAEERCEVCAPARKVKASRWRRWRDRWRLSRQSEPIGDGRGTDLHRIRGCWARVNGENRGRRNRQAAETAFKDACREFAAVQRQLAVGGARDDAIAVYRQRLALMRAYDRRRHGARWARSCAGLLLSRNSSSVKQLIGVLVLLYGLLIPALWAVSGVVHPAGEASGDFFEAIVFSTANVADFTPGHFMAGDALVTFLQALQALSGYFALGVALWISQRSYES